MSATTPTFVIEFALRVNDQQNRSLTQKFEFGRMLYNATLGTALGRLQRMRESEQWRQVCAMPKGKERNKRFSELQKSCGLTENGLRTIANNHRKASGRNDIGAHEAQCIGRTVWRALGRYLFKDAGKPRFKSFTRGLNSIEGTDNHEIMYKPERPVLCSLPLTGIAFWATPVCLTISQKRPMPERQKSPFTSQEMLEVEGSVVS